MYGVELWTSMWHCTRDVAETLSLANAVTSAVASAAASCCSVFGSGAMSAAVPAVAAVLTAVCGCPHLLIVLHPSGTHCSLAETSILLGADRLASRQ
jgi:hypothetical protein